MKTLICDCNGTLNLDAAALREALGQVPGAHATGVSAPHTLLCRKQAADFQRAAKTGEELLVACTQEQRLFLDLAEHTEGSPSVQERPIRFVNLRERAGWGRQSDGVRPLSAEAVTPKMAALIAAAQRPLPEPSAPVTYRSQGRCLVMGPRARVLAMVPSLSADLELQLLCTPEAQAPAPSWTPWPAPVVLARSGHSPQVQGWLGRFTVQWTEDNPIDLDLCTHCNACVSACPEGAIGADHQIDLGRCAQHRQCEAVCEVASAIDFTRAARQASAEVDMVLDLHDKPAFSQHQPPQGYVHLPPAAGEGQRAQGLRQLAAWVGEFDKPKFFHYKAKLCAHSRNEQLGCTACIDVCSARAIRSDASLKGKVSGQAKARGPQMKPAVGGQSGHIVVEPFLCVGCGACTTVCPSGALSYQWPTPAEQGQQLRTQLQAWRAAGGARKPGAPVLWLHSQERGAQRLDELAQAAMQQRPGAASPRRGIPARVLPVPLWHTASVGLELWLSALCWGAAEVVVMLAGDEAPDYTTALTEQVAIAQALWSGLGQAGVGVRLVDAGALDSAQLDALMHSVAAQAPTGLATPAPFAALADKRATLDLCVDHLIAQAPSAVPETLPLPAGQRFGASPLGSLQVNADRCTLCLSCVGACPEAALQDNPDAPQLRFIEKNCVQCGLCATTCPEQAITLQPRLLTADGGKARAQVRVLHEVEPYRCVKCAKPFGTLKAIEAMMAKLAHHPAFAGPAAERLKMCGDCRVIDLHTQPSEVRITDL